MGEHQAAAGVRVSGVRPAELERALLSPEGMAAVPAEARQEAGERLEELRRGLCRSVCSESWLRHCWSSGEAFPPSAATTPMIACECPRCRRTGRLWPANYGVTAAAADVPAGATKGQVMSYECYLESLNDWEAAQLPSSPSGLAMRAIREGRVSVRFRRTRVGWRR